MQVIFDLPDEVVNQLQPFADKLPQILELGLRELNANAESGFSGMAEVVEFLASLPTAEAIIALRPSESLQAQINTLVEKNRTVGLTGEQREKVRSGFSSQLNLYILNKTWFLSCDRIPKQAIYVPGFSTSQNRVAPV